VHHLASSRGTSKVFGIRVLPEPASRGSRIVVPLLISDSRIGLLVREALLRRSGVDGIGNASMNIGRREKLQCCMLFCSPETHLSGAVVIKVLRTRFHLQLNVYPAD
jgi:hypothetical protein